ncbi:ATP-dependent DNA helicase [Aidingimonas lacisalsi]|uniref:ATP-dependent DNA helicase n=1 Tax=Aidingimonas lacisalsi TaxID=2604086 RepID=UPI0011D210CB|nr:ATP-dependent DNA helicase [Aidingimonas lacisalsi]
MTVSGLHGVLRDDGVEGLTYRVTVRSLCEFTAKAGNLDHRFTPSPSAQQGIAGHARVAARRGEPYEAELSLSGDYVPAAAYGDELGHLVVTGRADGYDPDANRLEEVKTYRGRLDRMPDNQRALHWAQVRIYGALLCRARALTTVNLALVYLELSTDRETVLTETLSAESLECLFREQCHIFLAWARQEACHRHRRDEVLSALRFPHASFRAGQRTLAESTFKAASTGRCLLAQAPTGIGKTMGTLFPMLMAMPRRGIDRLFFLSMKTSGRALALAAMESLLGEASANASPPWRTLELIARDKACEHPDKACHGESCPLARGFYDRLPQARQEAVSRVGILDREAVKDIALRHSVCPYYLSQELARWCDVVVGDINYYFDTSAMLYALTQTNEWRVAVLVDEAHNLVSRGQGMYSATLDQRRVNALWRTAPPALSRSLARVARQWAALVKSATTEVSGEAFPAPSDGESYHVLAHPPEALLGALGQAAATLSDYLGEHPEAVMPEWQSFLFDVLHFIRLAESFDDGHSQFDLTRWARGRSRLCLRNMIPADFLSPRLSRSQTTVLFSATLSPARYYLDVLGLPANTAWVEVESPFDASQLEVCIRRDISTRYADRDASVDPIVATLAEQYHRMPGNYLAFFSSFAYLESVAARFAACHGEIPHWRQSPHMDEDARRAFLAHFTVQGRGIGFAVLGGAFAEGVDLVGERLVGAFIATLGLPPCNSVNERLKSCLQARFGHGADYAYRVPGLTKVVQAAGRVIRGPDERGVVILMDDRFSRSDVQALLPGWWKLAERAMPEAQASWRPLDGRE